MELLVHRAYCGIWRAAEPLVAWYIKRKDLRRGVLPVCTAERFGVSKLPAEWKQHARGEYFTLWIHGASVGECLSALPLIEMLLAEPFALEMKTTTIVSDGALSTSRRKARIVLTTTTPAARQLLNSRLASITLKTPCIFAPMDHPDWVKRFYDTWQPDAGLWIESELWPNLIHEATTRQFRIGILNGRISERSFRRWQLPVLNSFAHSLVSPFSMVLCQNEQNLKRFAALGAPQGDILTNLKFATTQCDSDAAAVTRIQEAIGNRYAWAAISTHEGEELAIARVHTELANRIAASDNRRVITFIVPRHPHRAKSIADEIQREFPDLDTAFRSENSLPHPSTSIFIVDTMGETGLLCDAISTVFIGGTFAERGGHNPIEPLRAGCKVFVGPNMQNFEDIVAKIETTALEQQSRVTAVTDEPVICSVQRPSDLARALLRHFTSMADQEAGMPITSTKNQQHQSMMRTLAAQSLQAHERKLLEWLAK